MLIYYSEVEGAIWKPLRVNNDIDSMIHMLDNFHDVPGESSEIVTGDSSFKCHAVLFPDDQIWDATLAGIGQRPQEEGYFREVFDLVGGLNAGN